MLLTVLQVALVAAGGVTWCGQPECGAKPACSAAELDLIIALDDSCSMSTSDWSKETGFAAALANATQYKFNVSRFAGIVFGYADPNNYVKPIGRTSRIFHNMAPGAAAFTNSLPGYNCGGTPTDEALYWFFDELNRTRIPDRMQMAVLVTDGIPTLCYTLDGNCDGTSTTAGNTVRATNAAITEHDKPGKLKSLGSLLMTVGIGSALNNSIGTTTYGNINGADLLGRFASASQLAFFPTDFNVLITQTLAQVLDNLCFYLIDVDSPKRTACTSQGTEYVIRGYNFFSLGNPMCRWQEVGTSNFLYTPATINATNQTTDDPGVVGLVICKAPVVPTDPFNAILEISRDGTYYTNNGYSVLLRNDCNAPIPPRVCPTSTVAAVFQACTPSDFDSKNCSAACSNASSILGQMFDAQGRYAPAFNSTEVSNCISSNYPTTAPWTPTTKATMIARSGPGKGPCVVPPPQDVAGAATLSAALLSTICLALAL